MAVVAVFSWKVKPGRMQEFRGRVAEAQKIHERLGARVRVLLPQYSGEPNVAYLTQLGRVGSQVCNIGAR